MKNVMRCRFFKSMLTFVFLLLTEIIWAQDNNASTTTSTSHTTSTTETWYVSPLVWVGVGIGALIIIVALISRGGRTDKVIIKKSEEV